ncbi:MAG TPA: hypothetical protein G4O03_01260 [Dehalococcoidia bacterium]|nr:hypothetical protein [Dehalococcoidia bacterium]
MARKFEDILDDCLERLNRGETVEECLARYPEHEAELVPLLKLSTSLRAAWSHQVRPQFRAAARHNLVSAIEAKRPRARIAPRAWWRRGWVVAATVIALLVLAGGSTVAASGNSLPDQPLYPVKLATEKVRLVLTRSEMGKARLHAQFAETRLKETIEMAKRNRPEQVEKLTRRLQKHLDDLPALVRAHPSADGELELLVQRLQQNRARAEAQLQEQLRRVPPPARAALRQALERARNSYWSALAEIQLQR